ncbi:hypothetical protein J2X31_000577 [Flavobacterium arsenatis]|uniref:Outer membrane protein beta-barrel domain-containing protein n=1 Tax=Flavobacterium arsenatis TaxID=1484332 RepID=A0ABU1TKV1_9FLAO|nr:hypothetical protein [Flavobacterium arsenatis]MDR6966579.1 hypothetical protein [Flavobacterium arsenatis]
MKKLLFSALLLIGLCNVANAQLDGFRVGVSGGLPLSDASDISSFNVGVDASYLFGITDTFAAGVATGYSTFLGKDGFDDYSFIPVALSLRAGYGSSIFYTADIGYAVATTTDAEGGLYLLPKAGWTNGQWDAFIFYKNIDADDVSVASIGVGAAYKF